MHDIKIIYITLCLYIIIIVTCIPTKAASRKEKECILPLLPSFGWWTVINTPSALSSWLEVPAGTTLELHCEEMYKLDGCTVVVCIHGIWFPPIGHCLKKCPSIYSTSKMNVTCTFKEQKKINCVDSMEGTLAEFKCLGECKDQRSSQAMCVNGKWLQEMTDFPSVCGSPDDGITATRLLLDSKFSTRVNLDCVLPPNPSNGWWSVLHYTKSEPKTIMTVPKGTVLQMNCNDSYMLDGSKIVVCVDGKWIPEVGQCLKTCPPLNSQTTVSVTCTYKDRETTNCTNALEGTYAQVTCGYFYKDVRRNRRKIFCENGKWSENITACVPACGQSDVDRTLIVHGRTAKQGDFPWQVALYEKQEEKLSNSLICSGSLLSKKLVLTAAHCVTDEFGKIRPKYLFFVAVGKYYRKYDDDRDFGKAQFSHVQQIIIDEHYSGAYKLFEADIALIVTSTTFTLSERVRPVCIDWTDSYKLDILNLEESQIAEVPGWGYTEDGSPSEVIKNLTVPLITYQECNNNLPKDFQEYFTTDKLCAGYFRKGISLCKGDSGGGLIVKFDSKYYVTGVVSVGPLSKDLFYCDVNQYSLYTNVYNYIETFILPKIIAFKSIEDSDSDECKYDPKKCDIFSFPQTEVSTFGSPIPLPKSCLLPEHPQNGTWTLISETSYDSYLNSTTLPSYILESIKQYEHSYKLPNKLPFDSVLVGSILRITCKPGYRLDGNITVSCTEQQGIFNSSYFGWAFDIGRCIKICSNFGDTDSLKVACYYQTKKVKNCTDPFEGTIAKFKCAPFYESRLTENLPMVCLNHKWTGDIPECIPRCGRKSKQLFKNGRFPWHIAIYDLKREKFICSGTLINEKVVLTAASCIANEKGDFLSIEDLSLVAGKLYQNFRDARDFNSTQFFPVSKIFVPSQYKTSNGNQVGDIAILVAKTPFKLSHEVQTICVDWGREYEKEVLSAEDKIAFFASGWLDSEKAFSHIQVHPFNRNECKNFLKTDVPHDKLCSPKSDATMNCTSYLGSNLVYKKEDRYYLAGVLNTSSKKDLCKEYHFFTSVYNYTDSFLLKNIN